MRTWLTTAGMFLVCSHLNPAPCSAGPPITEENWRDDARILEALSQVEEVREGLTTGRLALERKDYGGSRPECRSRSLDRHPVVSKALARSKTGVVRYFRLARLVTHGDIVVIERYFDEAGTFRFGRTREPGAVYEVFGGLQGQLVWSVRRTPDGDEVYDVVREGDYVLEPRETSTVERLFEVTEPSCDHS